MPQTLFEASENRLVIASLDIDDPVRRQTGLGEGGGEEVGPRDAPEDFAAGPCRDPSGEEDSRRAVDGAVAATRHLMQRTAGEPPVGKPGVDSGHSKG